LKPGLGSLKVIENDTIRSDTHDFLLTFHSNHRPISHRFQDKRRFPSKIAHFSRPRVFCAPLKGFLWELGIGARGQKTRIMGLPRWERSLTIFSAIWTQYTNVTDRRTDGRTDRRTDGQTDTGRQQRPRLRIASRGKNDWVIEFWSIHIIMLGYLFIHSCFYCFYFCFFSLLRV